MAKGCHTLLRAGHPVSVEASRHTLGQVYPGEWTSGDVGGIEDAEIGGERGVVGGVDHDECPKFAFAAWVVGNNCLANGGASTECIGLVGARLEVVANDAVEAEAHWSVKGGRGEAVAVL